MIGGIKPMKKSNGMKAKVPAIFSVIGRSVVDWWDAWLDLVGAVLVWLLAQFTIVLGPPATFGLYYTAHRLINNGESLGGRGVIEGGRKYFGMSWLWVLLNVIAMTITYANFQFYGTFDNFWAAYAQIFFLMVGFIWIVVQFFALAFLMEMKEKKLLLAIRNGFFASMASPLFSLFVILFALFAVLFSAVLVLPVFFGVPALVPILAVRAMYNRLEVYGVRERDKTPKEIEREQSSRIEVPSMHEVADGEGQVEDKH
jgi:hypothetical protein